MKTGNKNFDIDIIVFDNAGLMRALEDGYTNIGLCDNAFHIPPEYNHLHYSGLGDAAAIVYISGDKPLDGFSALEVKRVITGMPQSSAPAVDKCGSGSYVHGSYMYGSYRTSSGSYVFGSYRYHEHEYEFEYGGSYTTSFRAGSYRYGSYKYRLTSAGSYRAVYRHHTGPWGELLDELFGLDISPGGYGLELI